MKQLRNMWLLMVKDLKIFAADRTALIFAILFPFFFIVLFNFVMGGVGGSDQRLVINLPKADISITEQKPEDAWPDSVFAGPAAQTTDLPREQAAPARTARRSATVASPPPALAKVDGEHR